MRVKKIIYDINVVWYNYILKNNHSQIDLGDRQITTWNRSDECNKLVHQQAKPPLLPTESDILFQMTQNWWKIHIYVLLWPVMLIVTSSSSSIPYVESEIQLSCCVSNRLLFARFCLIDNWRTQFDGGLSAICPSSKIFIS